MNAVKAITVVVIITAFVLGGLVGIDLFLKNTFGIGLLDIFSVLLESGNTLENAPSLDDVADQIDNASYQSLKESRDEIIDTFNNASPALELLGSDEEFVQTLANTFGEDYLIYLFTVTKVGDLEFKVFEWSMGFDNGEITPFEVGKTYDSYNVYAQIDQEVASSLLAGQASQKQITQWIKDKKMKIKPLLEAPKFITALPAISQAIQQSQA